MSYIKIFIQEPKIYENMKHKYKTDGIMLLSLTIFTLVFHPRSVVIMVTCNSYVFILLPTNLNSEAIILK